MEPIENLDWAIDNTADEDVSPSTVLEQTQGWMRPPNAPKREVFNWWMRGVGRWVDHLKDKVTEAQNSIHDILVRIDGLDGLVAIMSGDLAYINANIVSRWFVEVDGVAEIPPETGIYKHALDHRFYVVKDNHMATIGFSNTWYSSMYYTHNGTNWVQGSSFSRSNSFQDVSSGSEVNYVTPKGVKEYILGLTTQTVDTPTHKQWAVKAEGSSDSYVEVYGMIKNSSNFVDISMPRSYPGGTGYVYTPAFANLMQATVGTSVSSTTIDNRGGGSGTILTINLTGSAGNAAWVCYQVLGKTS